MTMGLVVMLSRMAVRMGATVRSRLSCFFSRCTKSEKAPDHERGRGGASQRRRVWMRSVRRGRAYPGLLLLALGPLDHVFNGVCNCLMVRPALQGGVVIYHAGPLSRN